MCSTCGCGGGAPSSHDHGHEHRHADGTVHSHAHDHGHEHGHGRHDHDHEHPHGHAKHGHDHAHAPAGDIVKVEQAILSENARFAAYNRGYFDGRRIRCFNLISAPGSGKTTLLERTLAELIARDVPVAVVEGDQQTDNDARRIAKTGAKVFQIETGKACHLDAHQVGHAVETLAPADGALLFVENVGNLICPTEFDLGEHQRIVMLSVTEGTDKPAKYPLAFRSATAVVLTKTDLAPYVDFDTAEALRLVRGLNPKAPVFQLSSRTGDGFEAWLEWLRHA